MAIMPLDSASSPFFCRRRTMRSPITAGEFQTARNSDHKNIAAAIAATRMTTARNTEVSMS